MLLPSLLPIPSHVNLINMKRRRFIRNSSLFSLATLAGAPALFASAMKVERLGIQLFSLPRMLSENFSGALEMLAKMGYKELELYGPYTFSAESAQVRWKGLTPRLGFSGSGYFGMAQDEFHDAIRSHGFSIPSMHTDLDTLENHMGPLAEAANALGARYVVLPAIPPERRTSMEDYKAMADAFNILGSEAEKHGIRFAYHNHGYGLSPVNGELPLELLLDRTGDKVFLEMDLFWTTAGGADPVALLNKYSGRYKMLHIKDMTEQARFSGDGGDPGQWMELFPLMCSAGEGVLDLPKILAAAQENGAAHFFVEQDMVADPAVALDKSFENLQEILKP